MEKLGKFIYEHPFATAIVIGLLNIVWWGGLFIGAVLVIKKVFF